MPSYDIVSYIAEAVDFNQKTSIIVLASISDDHAIFTLASSPKSILSIFLYNFDLHLQVYEIQIK
jgi:hypothetical protein